MVCTTAVGVVEIVHVVFKEEADLLEEMEKDEVTLDYGSAGSRGRHANRSSRTSRLPFERLQAT